MLIFSKRTMLLRFVRGSASVSLIQKLRKELSFPPALKSFRCWGVRECERGTTGFHNSQKVGFKQINHHIHQFVSPLIQTSEEKQPVAVRVCFGTPSVVLWSTSSFLWVRGEPENQGGSGVWERSLPDPPRPGCRGGGGEESPGVE